MVQLVIFFLLIMVIYPEQLCVWGIQAISALCYVETMKMVLVTIWPSRAMVVQTGMYFLIIIVKHPEQFV